MITKQISVKRTYNLGNYENRVIERTVELNEGDDADTIQSELVEKVERDVRKDWFEGLEKDLHEKRSKLTELSREIEEARTEKHRLRKEVLESGELVKEFLLNLFTKDELAELCGLNNSEKSDYELAEIVEEE